MPDQPAARSLALPVLDADVTRRRFLLGLVTTTAAVAAGNVLGLRAAHAAVPIPAALPVGISPDVDGVSTEARPGDGNFDGAGWAYAAELLPSGRTTIGGVPFDFPANYADGSKNFLASNGQTLALPAGKHALVYLVGAAHHGAVDAKATVTYTDGSTAAVPFQFTDWAVSPRFGEAIAVQCPYRHDANGRTSPPVALFLQTIPLDPAKEARSLTLPQAPNAKLIAATVQPAVQGVAVKIIGTGSTDLFVGTEAAPRQVVRVSVVNVGSAAVSADAPALITLRGDGVSSPEPARLTALAPGAQATVDLGVTFAAKAQEGTVIRAEVIAESKDATDTEPVEVVVAEPGWTMFMVSHFHYDPVWWNTQGAYTETWQNSGTSQPGLALVKAHLDLARRDPDYKFVLAELDYLKPYWDFHPEDRAYLRQLVKEGRLEYMGGTYNEPSPNLTSAELTIRNVVYGMGYQRAVLGGDPQSAWMLDVFGHDPQFPGICADGGLTSSSWARGPHHEWGPKASVGDNTRMQFASEFDWVSPSGKALLTSYMPNHYSAGWWMDSSPNLDAAMAACYQLFQDLKSVAATKNTLLPVGTDYTPPNRWVTKIHREWAARYVWPKFACGTPRDFFDAVRAEAKARKLTFTPQTRDMNPIFTGCYITYIDTKQAQREAENTLMAAEKFATVAALLGARYPSEAFDKAWRQLCYGAHHDGITGSESDQVYLDLHAGWREALELSKAALAGAQNHIASRVDTRGDGTPILVFNPLSFARTDVAWAEVSFRRTGTAGFQLLDPTGKPVTVHIDRVERHPDGSLRAVKIAFVAKDVPATGYATYRVVRDRHRVEGSTWRKVSGSAIENEHYRVEVDPSKGGAVTRLLDKDAGKEMLRPGGVANELLAYDEYVDGPGAPANGPWVTVQKGGPVASSTQFPAAVTVEECPIGRRITVSSPFSQCARTQEIWLFSGVDRVDFATRIDQFAARDRLMRVRFQPAVTGGMPVSETANATIGRGFGFPNVDYAKATWTLDYPAYNWFELGSTLSVKLSSGAARAVSVAEVILPDPAGYDREARAAVAALVRRGVTSTVSRHDGSRYGALDVDSNLPDVRISVGAPDQNAFTNAVLDAVDPGYRAEFDRQLATTGQARVWVPAAKPLAETWVPKADLRGPRALPVLLVAGRDTRDSKRALAALSRDVDRTTVISVKQPAALDGTTGSLESYGFAVLNRGIPAFNVDPAGDLYLGFLRSSTGWPSGVWIDPPQRTLPDGAPFQTQHWSQTFEYSVIGHRGDWRGAKLPQRGHAYNNPFQVRQASSHGGSLPARAALLEVKPDPVIVTAVKPRGNPMAAQGDPEVDPANGLVVRAYESTGQPTDARIRFFRPLTDARSANLLEARAGRLDTDDGAVELELDGFEITTVAAKPRARRGDKPRPDSAVELALRTEPAQPVYAQYWRHNKGAAPIGYQPVTVRLSPEVAQGPGPYEVTVTVASERSDVTTRGTVRFVLPDGWKAQPARREYALASGASTTFSATVTPPSGAPVGRYFVAARLTADGQRHEAVTTVDLRAGANRELTSAGTALAGGRRTKPIPDTPYEQSLSLSVDKTTRKARVVEPAPSPEPLAAGPELDAAVVGNAVRLLPGQRGALQVRLTNGARSEIRGEAQLVTPYAIWSMTQPWTQGFAVAPGGAELVEFDVSVPPDARPGAWWALVKLMYFGRLIYTKTVPVVVADSPLSVEGADFHVGTGGSGEAVFTVANIADEPASGTLAVTAPTGWAVEPATVPFGPLARGESVQLTVTVNVPADTTPGVHPIAATARAGTASASTSVRAIVIGTKFEFDPGTPDEALWLYDADSSQIGGDGRRYADNDRYWVYRFAVPADTTAASVALDIDNEFLVEASADGQAWTEVLKEVREIRDGSNRAVRTVELTPYLGTKTAFVRVRDSFPADGWGGRVAHVVVNLVRGAR